MREHFIEKLQNGETVEMKVHGNSMTPIMKTGQTIRVIPVTSEEDVKKGDAVFCHVAGMLTVHKVTGKKKEKGRWMFQISNNHGHVNGWTPLSKVYGKFTEVINKQK